MGLSDLVNKGKEFYSKDGKFDSSKVTEDAKDAYASFQQKDGTLTDKAKKTYTDIQENHKVGSSDVKSDKTDTVPSA